jgi:hypothetical protein
MTYTAENPHADGRAEEIADREMGLWKMRTVPLSKTDDPLLESWSGRGVRKIGCAPTWRAWPAECWRFPATSASPERLFSTAGNEMTKERTRFTCDNLETIVYLHEVWPKVREWQACKRFMADSVVYN